MSDLEKYAYLFTKAQLAGAVINWKTGEVSPPK